MTTPFLISCCNTGPLLSEFGLVIFDPEQPNDPFAYLDLNGSGLDFAAITGFTGICRFGDEYVIGVQSKPSGLVVFDQTLGFLRYIKLPEYLDLHSMREVNGRLCAAATAMNQIVEIDLASGRLREVWKAHTQRNLHVNAFSFRDQNLLVLCHQNPREKANRAGAGVVWDQSDDRILLDSLWHPHDLFERPDGKIVVLSSASYRSHVLDLAESSKREDRRFPGYVRGYCERDEQQDVAVGLSAIRMVSRKEGASKRYYRGSFSDYAKDPLFQSFVAYGARDQEELRYFPFTHVNFEIYEIHPLGPAAKPNVVPKPEAKRHLIFRWLLNRD